MSDPVGARWASILLAAASLAGVLVGWSTLFRDLALQFETAGGGLSPRQAQLEQVVVQARLVAPGARDVLMLSVDAQEYAFAKYLCYPAIVRLASVRQQRAVRAALADLQAGALVLVSRHGDVERLEDLERLARGAEPRLQQVARAGDEVAAYRVLR